MKISFHRRTYPENAKNRLPYDNAAQIRPFAERRNVVYFVPEKESRRPPYPDKHTPRLTAGALTGAGIREIMYGE